MNCGPTAAITKTVFFAPEQTYVPPRLLQHFLKRSLLRKGPAEFLYRTGNFRAAAIGEHFRQ